MSSPHPVVPFGVWQSYRVHGAPSDEEKGVGGSDMTSSSGPTTASAKLGACLGELRDLMDKRWEAVFSSLCDAWAHPHRVLLAGWGCGMLSSDSMSLSVVTCMSSPVLHKAQSREICPVGWCTWAPFLHI
jgi:hypothetical protein